MCLQRYGLISFALVFLVEQLGGILQATLTLNGLIGGVTLGLFSLGIFFKVANSTVRYIIYKYNAGINFFSLKGALYGGLTSLVLVVYIGVMAQIKSVAVIPLPTLMDGCDCFQNGTITDAVPEADSQ